MALDDWIPGAGDRTVKQRIRELDEDLLSIVVIIGIGFSKIFEGLVAALVTRWPVYLLGFDLSDAFWWTIYTLVWGAAFIYGKKASEAVEETAEKAKEKAEETAEKAKEKTEEAKE